MPCRHYKNALIEGPASGAQPQGELRAHLDACASCRAAFEQEQSLFAAIDAGLHVAANAQVPASLLPRVRARVDGESSPRRVWVSNWLVLASATVMVVAFFAARGIWRPNIQKNSAINAVRTNSPSSARTAPQIAVSPFVPPPKRGSVSLSGIANGSNSILSERPAVRKAAPEVLVPGDQEVLLVRYAQQWRRRKLAPLVTEESDAKAWLPLQVAPIQIAQLDVKLLAEEKSQ
jgi:hypothetical protein